MSNRRSQTFGRDKALDAIEETQRSGARGEGTPQPEPTPLNPW
jgi:hypothetical protein